jgi:hypothetical protein
MLEIFFWGTYYTQVIIEVNNNGEYELIFFYFLQNKF